MKWNAVRQSLRYLFLTALLLGSLSVPAQEYVSPLNIPLYLSGNFGELRHNHFHSGIDFKTQGVVGKPVRAVKEGHISRIAVSPYGYGRAVYIDHPNGLTSVYAHLEYFSDRIEQAVRDSQYRKETFAVNLYFTPEDFPLKQGEVFAYSGNTGSSGGPHVHFEFRETESERPIDPLPFYKDKIKDTRPPDIQGIMAFPIEGEGAVNGSDKKLSVALNKDKSGIAQALTAWGRIGLGIKAYDRMNDTNNIYGVYETILLQDGDTIFHSEMRSFSFDDTRYLNSYIDWEDWIERKSFYMKSFTDPGNYLGMNLSLSNGLVEISEERAYRFQYILRDIYGNTSRLSFSVQGKKSIIPEQDTEGKTCFLYNRDNYYQHQGIELRIPRKNLYATACLRIDTVSGGSPYAPLYRIGERIPLHAYCPLTLSITGDTHPLPSQYGIAHIHKGKTTWLGGEYSEGKVTTRIRELGNFAVMTDTNPPLITPVGENKWTANRKLSFRITDDLSGIKDYRGTLDGQFVLFEYDAKRNALFCDFDKNRMKTGRHALELTVTDGVGNQSTWQGEVVF